MPALRKSSVLRPGDPVAVIAPASPPRDLAPYEAGLAHLRTLYDVRATFDAAAARGYLSAPDEMRLDALNACLRNPDLKAIFCVRGGYGALRLLKRLDYDAARAHPKLLVGYSDITALHLALYHRAGWVGLSGPVITEWHQMDADMERLYRTLAEGDRVDTVLGPSGEALTPVQPGDREGPLLGGNLSVLTRLLGTPYCPDFEGAILFLEDVGEVPYRIDRMLAHLDLAGVLDRLAGVVLGQFTAVSEPDAPSLSLPEVFDDYFAGRSYPVARDLVYGHLMPRAAVPIGVQARLAVTETEATLSILEPLVQ